MNKRDFEDLVTEAVEGLPKMFREKLRNIEVFVAERPSPDQEERFGDRGAYLFGLYEGIPYGERGHYPTGALPDRITIFKIPIEQAYRTRSEIIRCVQETVLHEVGHFFGFSDEQLRRMGY